MKLSKKHDPTRTATRVNKASAQFRRRLREAASACEQYVKDMPRQLVVNALTTNVKRSLFGNRSYSFELNPDIMEQVERDINRIMAEALIDEDWLASQFVGPAYASGTAQAATTLGAQLSQYTSDINSIVLSPAYQLRLKLVKQRTFEEMMGFTDEVASKVAGQLGRAILDGLNPLDVAGDIAASINGQFYRGERIARTEITTALRRGRLDEGDAAAEQIGLRVMYMHISAFAPTSRQTHMARHGKLFTSQECREWWARDANSVNCLCSTVEVFVDEVGKPLAPGLLSKAAEIKAKYEAENV